MTICAVYSIHTYICSVYIYIYIYIHWKHPPNSKSWEIPTLPWPLPEKLSIGASWWIKSNGAKRGLIFQKPPLKKLPKISHNHGSSGKWNHPKWKETHHCWRHTHFSTHFFFWRKNLVEFKIIHHFRILQWFVNFCKEGFMENRCLHPCRSPVVWMIGLRSGLDFWLHNYWSLPSRKTNISHQTGKGRNHLQKVIFDGIW